MSNLLRWAAEIRPRLPLALAISLALAAIAVLARIMMPSDIHGAPFITIFPAVVLATVFGGMAGGAIVIAAGGLAAWFWPLPPVHSMTLDRDGILLLASFLATASLMVVVVAALNHATEAEGRKNARIEALFVELQHRVANNMAFVAALLRLQRRSVDAEAAAALDDAGNRIATMSRIHRMLYAPDALERPFGDHLAALCRDVLDAAGASAVTVEVDAVEARIDLRSLMALSLIINEIVTNAAKHAFGPNGTGSIRLRAVRADGNLLITISDSGPGFPAGFDPSQSKRLGLLVVQNLLGGLSGSCVFHPGPGACIEIILPDVTDKSGNAIA